MNRFSQITLILLFLTTALWAQTPQGSNSLLYTQTARTFDQGRFEIRGNMNFFTKLSDFVGDPSLKPADFQANNYWLVNSAFALTYGAVEHFDITLAPGIYQDTHSSIEYNLPDDMRLALKIGSFAFMDRQMYGGFGVDVLFPIGEDHNYPFTRYASGALEYGFKGMLSYYVDPYLPDRSFSAHLNVGFWNHNEAGEELRPTGNAATTNSTELQYALGLLYPTELFDFQLEVYGISYIEQPDPFVFSREDYTYVTPSIKYKPMAWLDLILGLDIRVSGTDDESVGLPDYENVDIPNYSTWKAHLGFNITVLPLTAEAGAGEVERNQFNKRVEFFEDIIEDRERTEEIQEELNKLKEERKAAEKELEELKQILEEEG